MINSASYSETSGGTHTLFGQTMGWVAATAGCFTLGAYLARNASPGWAFVGFIASFACLIVMNLSWSNGFVNV